jgi:hypothetical protein
VTGTRPLRMYRTPLVANCGMCDDIDRFLSDGNYRKLYIEISKRGYRKAEPEGGPRETSQVLHKVFAALRAEGITQQVIASS